MSMYHDRRTFLRLAAAEWLRLPLLGARARRPPNAPAAHASRRPAQAASVTKVSYAYASPNGLHFVATVGGEKPELGAQVRARIRPADDDQLAQRGQRAGGRLGQRGRGDARLGVAGAGQGARHQAAVAGRRRHAVRAARAAGDQEGRRPEGQDARRLGTGRRRRHDRDQDHARREWAGRQRLHAGPGRRDLRPHRGDEGHARSTRCAQSRAAGVRSCATRASPRSTPPTTTRRSRACTRSCSLAQAELVPEQRRRAANLCAPGMRSRSGFTIRPTRTRCWRSPKRRWAAPTRAPRPGLQPARRSQIGLAEPAHQRKDAAAVRGQPEEGGRSRTCRRTR